MEEFEKLARKKLREREVMLAVKESIFNKLKQAKMGTWNDFILSLLNSAFWSNNGKLIPYYSYECSKCGTIFRTEKEAKFCPTCGEKVDESGN